MYTIVYNYYNLFYLPLKKFSNQNIIWKHPKFYMGNFFFTQARYIYIFHQVILLKYKTANAQIW